MGTHWVTVREGGHTVTIMVIEIEKETLAKQYNVS